MSSNRPSPCERLTSAASNAYQWGSSALSNIGWRWMAVDKYASAVIGTFWGARELGKYVFVLDDANSDPWPLWKSSFVMGGALVLAAGNGYISWHSRLPKMLYRPSSVTLQSEAKSTADKKAHASTTVALASEAKSTADEKEPMRWRCGGFGRVLYYSTYLIFISSACLTAASTYKDTVKDYEHLTYPSGQASVFQIGTNAALEFIRNHPYITLTGVNFALSTFCSYMVNMAERARDNARTFLQYKEGKSDTARVSYLGIFIGTLQVMGSSAYAYYSTSHTVPTLPWLSNISDADAALFCAWSTAPSFVSGMFQQMVAAQRLMQTRSIQLLYDQPNSRLTPKEDELIVVRETDAKLTAYFMKKTDVNKKEVARHTLSEDHSTSILGIFDEKRKSRSREILSQMAGLLPWMEQLPPNIQIISASTEATERNTLYLIQNNNGTTNVLYHDADPATASITEVTISNQEIYDLINLTMSNTIHYSKLGMLWQTAEEKEIQNSLLAECFHMADSTYILLNGMDSVATGGLFSFSLVQVLSQLLEVSRYDWRLLLAVFPLITLITTIVNYSNSDDLLVQSENNTDIYENRKQTQRAEQDNAALPMMMPRNGRSRSRGRSNWAQLFCCCSRDSNNATSSRGEFGITDDSPPPSPTSDSDLPESPTTYGSGSSGMLRASGNHR